MATIAQKLQLKTGQRLAILQAPPGTSERISTELDGIELRFSLEGEPSAVLLFVTTRAEVEAQAPAAIAAAGADGLLWIAYPKGGSKVKTDLQRDLLAAAVKPTGWQPVRLVAIDETWSAMRFRPAEKVGR